MAIFGFNILALLLFLFSSDTLRVLKDIRHIQAKVTAEIPEWEIEMVTA